MGGRTRRVGIKVDADVRDFNAGMASASRSVRGFVLEMGAASQSIFSRTNLMQAGIAGVAIGTVAALRSTAGAAAAFEVQMRNVNSIVHASEAQFQRMSADVLALGQTLPQSAETLAAGLYDIASSGFQGAEGIQVLRSAAVAATAGMTDTATAAKGITAVLNAYGLEASEAGEVSDVLFQTVNLGVITFEELSNVIGDFVGIAAAAGVAIDEAAAALATMTLSGIGAEEAGTSLNRLIQALVQPSDQLQAVWRGISSESIAATLAQDGLGVVMEKLRQVVGGNVQVLLALFPNIRAARGAFAVLANEGKNYAEVQAGITDEQRRANATQNAFNEQMKATSNALRLVGNGVRIWAAELGTKALPAIRSLISSGRTFADTVAPAFQAVGDVIGYVGELAGQHSEVIYALALAYSVHLVKGVVMTTAALLLNTAQWVLNSVAVFQAQAAYVGMGVAMGAIALQAGVMGAALVAGLAIKNWIEAKSHAKELVGTMKEGVDTSTLGGLREWNTRLIEQGKVLEENGEKREGWLGAIQDLEDVLPWANDQHAKNTQAQQENAAAQEEASIALENFTDNAIAAGKVTGLSIDGIDKLAHKYGIDLTQSGEAGRRAVMALTEAIEIDRREIGLTKEEFASLGVDGVDAITKIAESAADARDQFLETFGLLADFEFPNADQAAKDVEDATKKVRDAEDKLADAREKAAEADRYIGSDPQRDREGAKARRDVAEAERELAEAREEARKAAEVQLDPEKAIADQYEKQIDAAEQFVNDLDTVAKMGKGKEGVAEFLLKAQLNPEEYGPILRAIAEDTDGSLLDTIAASETRLKELGATFEAQFGVMQTAVENGMTKITDTMLDYLERAFTDPEGEKGVLAYRFGAYIAEKEKEGYEDGKKGVTEAERTQADLISGKTTIKAKAFGGIEPHIATAQTILYGERSTGGEAFIPLGSAHRGRSSMLLAEVAHMFGYGLVQMQRGGILSGASGGSSGPSQHYKTNSWNFYGDLSGPSMNDIVRFADRKTRLSKLAGGG